MVFKLKKQNKKGKKAFTILELSVVLILIGLLVVGVIGGKSLIEEAELAKAKSLTNSAPVLTAEDLILWLETTQAE